ncbi:MAG: bifunctional phosphoglucose/phosphomannose isomerase, partial [bacterium]
QIGEAFDLEINRHKIKNILFVGMGGSAISGDLIISCLNNELKVPAFVNRNYFLPNFVDQSSLVVVSSYSGNTEESLSCYDDARAKRSQIFGIASGGKLSHKAKQDDIPLIRIPGGAPPRTALGYLSIPILILLSRSGFATVEKGDLDETEKLLEQKLANYSPNAQDNLAFNLAERFKDKIPILYSSADFLSVVGMRWKCQFSENAKVLAFCNVFPEFNHNEIVGWQRLPHLLTKFQIIYLRDHDDYNRNQKRMNITQEIIERVTSPIIELFTEGNSRLSRLFSLIYLGDWVSFYLAIVNGIDPSPIEKIQILKDRLSSINEQI